MDSFHSTLQAIKWVSSVDQYIYSTLRVLSLSSLLYIIIYLYIFDISNDQVSICPWSYIEPVILETSTQSWLKEHLKIFFPEKRWRRQRLQPSNTDSNKPSNRQTIKADNKGSRQDLLGNIYLIYPKPNAYCIYTSLRRGKKPKRTTRQDIGNYEAPKQ